MLTEGEKAVRQAVDFLTAGEVVAIPSETVYGLAARCDSKQGVRKIFSVKNRPADNPLILHCDGIDMARRYVDDVDDRFYKLAESFWPGPLTIVTKRSSLVSDYITAGQDTVAVRIPNSSFFREVIAGCGVAIAAPSANISGKPSPTDANSVFTQLSGSIPLIVDGGSCSVGVESSIIYLGDGDATLLRPGDITRFELESVLGLGVGQTKKSSPSAPGMKYRHYAPFCEVILYCGNSFVKYLKDKKAPFGVVCHEEEIKDISAEKCISFGISNDEKQQQHRLFAILNSLDEYGLERWYIHAEKKHEAVFNRLFKAAEGKVDYE